MTDQDTRKEWVLVPKHPTPKMSQAVLEETKFCNPVGIYQKMLAAAPQIKAHPDDAAVDRFAAAMKAKLAKKRAEGRSGWDDKAQCTGEFLSALLREHVDKGDPLDVGNLAMMLHQRGERISAQPAASAEPREVDMTEYRAMLRHR